MSEKSFLPVNTDNEVGSREDECSGDDGRVDIFSEKLVDNLL